MKKIAFLGFVLVAALTITSCKSKESNYRKAYEKAQAQEMAQQTQSETVATVSPVTPVTTTVEDNSNVRSERLNVIGNGSLKAYNVVCGSFKSQENANNLRQTLVNKGYSAVVAQNPETGMYRVVASSFDDKASAVNSRDNLRSTYPDAWLLLRSN